MRKDAFQPRGFAMALRMAYAVLLLGILFSVAWLQLRSTESLERKSLKEQTRLVYVPACRGTLAARDGTPLNYSQPSYAIVIRPDLVRDPRDRRAETLNKLESVISSLGAALGPDFYQYRPDRKTVLRHLEQQPAMPLTLWDDVDADTRAKWLLMRKEYPGTELLLSWKRIYAFPDVSPQLRGMTRRQTPPRNALERYWNANSLELSGISGMEKALNYLLEGQSGSELLQTDVLSYRNNILESRSAIRGDDCRLALDLSAQRLAEEHFRKANLSGAAVALEMETGQVLVLASMPATPLGEENRDDISGGMMNRALAAYYPPGSVMKPLFAFYALEHGIATPEMAVECPGYFSLTEKLRLNCTHIHGNLTMSEAIAQSCNTYFCTLAQSFSSEQLDDFAEFFGFGQKTGQELAEQEIAGIPFTPGWVKTHRERDKVWHLGDTANGGIGQGGWIATPMQVALALNFALTGRLLSPSYYLNDELKIRRETTISTETKKTLQGGMRGCVTHGTGQSMKTDRLAILGKTGTAENGRNQRPHAWMVAAAPAEAPKYLVVVIVEHGGGGGRVAGPIAREILLELCAKQ